MASDDEKEVEGGCGGGGGDYGDKQRGGSYGGYGYRGIQLGDVSGTHTDGVQEGATRRGVHVVGGGPASQGED